MGNLKDNSIKTVEEMISEAKEMAQNTEPSLSEIIEFAMEEVNNFKNTRPSGFEGDGRYFSIINTKLEEALLFAREIERKSPYLKL